MRTKIEQPKLPFEKSTEIVSFRVPESIRVSVQALAAGAGISLSRYCEETIAQSLNGQGKHCKRVTIEIPDRLTALDRIRITRILVGLLDWIWQPEGHRA